MYERFVTLYEREDNGTESPMGEVELRVVYDDDVFGARIVAINSDGYQVCNHLIAMQTALNEKGNKCMWSALDFSLDPPSYRNFAATFKSDQDKKEFQETFDEGKDLADQAEILELPQEMNDPYYYGEGADYEEDGNS